VAVSLPEIEVKSPAPPWHPSKGSLSNRWMWLTGLAIVVTCAAIVWIAHGVAERLAIRSLRDSTTHRLDLYVANLQSEMRRYEQMPLIVGFDQRILALLKQPADLALQRTANEYLERVNQKAGASAIYVMDMHGLTLAASNWKQADSFVGMEFAYRPYFQDAAQGRTGSFYGIGTVSREPGYYYANSVLDGQSVTGVAAVKVNLDKLDKAWAHDGEAIIVADGNGVVFLASEPRWKFKTLRDLSRETVGRLAATKQYWKVGSLAPLGLTEERVFNDGTTIIEVASAEGRGAARHGTQYVVCGGDVQGTDWKLLVMADMAPVHSTARYSAVVAALTFLLSALLLLHIRQRYRIVAHTLATRGALQKANDELEEKVQVRTEALSDSNLKLQNEIAERKRAEETLKSTLQDLVHTAKMAILGKMSASITHELNQPLAALQTLSENTEVLLDRGRHDEAKANLRMIAHTTARMGRITGQLKKFARRSDIESEPVQVDVVLLDALFLLKQTLRARNIRLDCEPGAGVWALCNANRLEQVIVNLLSNAIDAVEHLPDPVICVVLARRDEAVRLEIHDNGNGINDAVAAHLFEPFHTTKEHGSGLGLGLAISNDIVRHFGGMVRAERSAKLGGALFIVHLKAMEQEQLHV
jgi:C4-dicarboxylate-specific signal transduction histidine kinase